MGKLKWVTTSGSFSCQDPLNSPKASAFRQLSVSFLCHPFSLAPFGASEKGRPRVVGCSPSRTAVVDVVADDAPSKCIKPVKFDRPMAENSMWQMNWLRVASLRLGSGLCIRPRRRAFVRTQSYLGTHTHTQTHTHTNTNTHTHTHTLTYDGVWDVGARPHATDTWCSPSSRPTSATNFAPGPLFVHEGRTGTAKRPHPAAI